MDRATCASKVWPSGREARPGRGNERPYGEVVVCYPTYVYALAVVALDVPSGVVTRTKTVLFFTPPGEVAVISLSLTDVNLAALSLNVTAVGPLRFDPVITTVVPPAAGPEVVLSPDTTGRR